MRGSPSYVSATLLIETFVQAATAVEKQKWRKGEKVEKRKRKKERKTIIMKLTQSQSQSQWEKRRR